MFSGLVHSVAAQILVLHKGENHQECELLDSWKDGTVSLHE